MHDASAEYLNLQNKDPDPSEIARIPQPEIVVRERLPEAPVPVSHEHSSASPAANLPGAQPEETRAQRRRRKRKEREREEQVIQAALEGKLKSGRSEMVAPQAGTGPSQAQPLPPKEPGGHEVAALQAEAGPSRAQRSSPNLPSNERVSLGSGATNSIMVTTSPPPPVNDRISSHRQGALAMTAGLVTEGVGCIPSDQSNTSSFESCP